MSEGVSVCTWTQKYPRYTLVSNISFLVVSRFVDLSIYWCLISSSKMLD